MYSTLRQGREIRRNHLNKLTRKPSLIIDCFTNTTPNFLQNHHYADRWKRLHIPFQSLSQPSPSPMSAASQSPSVANAVNLFYELVMYPKPPLCGIIQQYTRFLFQRFVIGVQVRIGGRQALYNDRQFLTLQDLPLFYNAIDDLILQNNRSLSNTYVFLSTDNKNVIQLFRKKYGESLVVTNEFAIGHSAPKKNIASTSNVMQHTQRAIIDLLLLQRSDILLVTEGSSFGQLAVALQSNRNSEIRTFDYMDSSIPDECNVFERSARPYRSFTISPTTPTAVLS